jgi:hypothetical protein
MTAQVAGGYFRPLPPGLRGQPGFDPRDDVGGELLLAVVFELVV